jgi:hypothetical protein
MIKEIELYFDINTSRVKMGKPPRDYRLFIVSKEMAQELDEEARQPGYPPSLTAFVERGYRNWLYNNVPVIWDEGVSERGVIAIEAELLDALNEARAGAATA